MTIQTTNPTDPRDRSVVPQRLVVKDTLSWHGVGFVPAGESARKEYGGPLVEGPWAYTFPLSHCIDNHGGTGREMRELRAQGLLIDVSEGDQIVVDGVTYAIAITTRGIDSWLTLNPEG